MRHDGRESHFDTDCPKGSGLAFYKFGEACCCTLLWMLAAAHTKQHKQTACNSMTKHLVHVCTTTATLQWWHPASWRVDQGRPQTLRGTGGRTQ